jgi:hypothetical protein
VLGIPDHICFARRLAHFVAFGLLILLFLTGARIAWFGQNILPTEWMVIADAVGSEGNAVALHIRCGLILLVLGLSHLAYLLVARRLRMAFGFFVSGNGIIVARLINLIAVLTAGVSVTTGVVLYLGAYDGAGVYRWIVGIHRWSALALIAISVIHIVDVFLRHRLTAVTVFSLSFKRGMLHRLGLVVALLVALFIWIFVIVPLKESPVVECPKLNRTVSVDGRGTELVWQSLEPVSLPLLGGGNFVGGASHATLKTFHDGAFMYVLLKWKDETQSLNRHLAKGDSGWAVVASTYRTPFGEQIYFEDMAAVSFHRDQGGCAATCHLTGGGELGHHATQSDTADLWQWRAVSTNPVWQADDGWWDAGVGEIGGGLHLDNIAGGGAVSNLNEEWQQPYFLSHHHLVRDFIDVESDIGIPYQPEDDSLAVGTIAPAVVVGRSQGDRSDVRARGRWRQGEWTVEFSRRLSTGSPFDIVMHETLYLGVAVFDNAEIKHAYHLLPIKMIIE